MQSTKFRHRIRIERKTESGDGYAWQEFVTVWADKQPLSAREFMVADQVVSKGEGFFVIHYRTGIDPTMRIVMGSEVFNILGVIEDNRSGRHWITMPYAKGTNEG